MTLATYLKTRTSTEFAKALGVSLAMVSLWRRGLRPVSLERCLEIEALTRGIVTAEDLRPDVAWRRLPRRGRR